MTFAEALPLFLEGRSIKDKTGTVWRMVDGSPKYRADDDKWYSPATVAWLSIFSAWEILPETDVRDLEIAAGRTENARLKREVARLTAELIDATAERDGHRCGSRHPDLAAMVCTLPLRHGGAGVWHANSHAIWPVKP